MDRNDKSYDRVSSTLISGGQEDPAGNAKLAQGIWDRYGHSPGVIPTGVTLGLVRRVTRLSTGRLPLLADIQRRWLAAGASFPLGLPALPYTWPTGFAGTMSPLTKVVQSASETASGNFGRANPIAPSRDLARDLDRSQRVVSALRAKVATSTEHPTAERIQRRSVGPSISPGKEAPILQPAAGPTQPASKGQDEVPVATSAGDLETAILRRHLRGPAAQAIQSRPKVPEAGHLDVFHRIERPVVLTRAIPGPDKMSLVEYHPDEANDSIPAGTGWSTGSSSSSGKEAPMPQPMTTEDRQPAGEAQTQVPMANRTENLGVSIVRRYLRGAAARVIQRKIASPELGRLCGSMTAATPLQSMILEKRIGKRIRDGTNPETSEELARVDGGFPPDTMVRVQARHSKSATGFTRSSELNQPPVSLINAHKVLRKPLTSQSDEPRGKPMGLITAQPAALVVQAQQEGVQTKNWRATEKGIKPANGHQASAAVQIPSYLSPLPKPDMLWRKSTKELPIRDLFSAGTSAGAKTPLPLTISSAAGSVLSMARQNTTPASSAIESGSPETAETVMPAAEKGPAQIGEMDLQQLAEQVSRFIFRKLVVERERRGIGRWH